MFFVSVSGCVGVVVDFATCVCVTVDVDEDVLRRIMVFYAVSRHDFGVNAADM